MEPMRSRTRAPKPVRKRPDRYHHGDLRRALLQEALRTIQAHGVGALTLRSVGEQLGVSRTALYRHFADKSALLAEVSREGFRTFRLALLEAWHTAPNTLDGFQAMGVAYVRFAMAHPSHYRVMFGGALDARASDPALAEEAGGAFQVLVGALAALQHRGFVRQEDPLQLARFVWAVVHGIAMLGIDGQLQHQGVDAEVLVRYAVERIRTGIAPAAVAGSSG
jgi:AcrR family transcriptional regulator